MAQDVKAEKQKALKKAIRQANREYGKNTVMRMGSDKAIMHMDTIPTGSLALDHAIGIGGYPKQRVIDVVGPESSGKTTLALEATANVQRSGGTVFYLDSENALNPSYAKHLGVNIDDLILCQPDSAEQGLTVATNMIKSGAVDLVVIDSVAALVPQAEIQGNLQQQHVGLQARLMSRFLQTVSSLLNKTNTCLFLINQLRNKIGSFMGGYTQPGGFALKFYSSLMITLSLGKKLKKGTQVIGREPLVTIKKNKVAPPFQRCHIDVMNGSNGTYGIDTTGEILNMATKKDIIDKAGAYYRYGSLNIQGRNRAINKLNSAPDIRHEIEMKVRKAYGMPLPDENQNSDSSNQDSPQSSTKKTTKTTNKKSSK